MRSWPAATATTRRSSCIRCPDIGVDSHRRAWLPSLVEPRGAATDQVRHARLRVIVTRAPPPAGGALGVSGPPREACGGYRMGTKLRRVNGIEFAVEDIALDEAGRHQIGLADLGMPGV